MKIIEMPIMGEGIHQGRIVSIKKFPGEDIKKDEIIYEIETDKAIMEVEAPIAGTIDRWLVSEGQLVSVGSPIVSIQPLHIKSSPRARRESREMQHTTTAEHSRHYTEKNLSVLSMKTYNLVGNKQALMLAASVNKQVSETEFRTLIENVRKSTEMTGFVSDWQCFAFHLVKIINKFPLFRSVLVGSRIRLYDQFNFGIAVNTSGGELVTAVIKSAEAMSFHQFSECYQENVAKAQSGQDQIEGNTPFILSILGNSGLSFAIPMLLPPASFVLYISDLTENGNKKIFNFTLTFNHLIVSGMQAAEFLNALIDDSAKNTSKQESQINQVTLSENVLETILFILKTDFNITADPSLSLGEQGIDSINALKLISKLNDTFNLSLPAFSIWQAPTVEKLSELILQYQH